MYDTSEHATWYSPYSFTLDNTHRVGARWWGSRADAGQRFRVAPCLTVQFSRAWPWLRIATEYRLCTSGLLDPHIATVTAQESASQLLHVILNDIKSFPICHDPTWEDPTWEDAV